MKQSILKTMTGFALLLGAAAACFTSIIPAEVQNSQEAVYCQNADELNAVFANAQNEQAESFQFECSEELINALLEDRSDLLYRVQYENNIVSANYSFDEYGVIQISDIVYADVFCAECGSEEDVSAAFSSYTKEENRPGIIVLFVNIDFYPELQDGTLLASKALLAGIEDYQMQYSDQSHLFIMSNITCTERSEEENTIISNDEAFTDMLMHYAASGDDSFLLRFDPGCFSELLNDPERMDTIIASSLLDRYSWQINEDENFIQLSDVSWLVSPIPYTYVKDREEYAAAINEFAEKQITRFTVVYEKSFFDSLAMDEGLMRSVQLSSRISTYESTMNSTFHYIRYQHVSFADVPSHFCASEEEFAEYLQTIASQNEESEAASSEYRVSFSEDLYHRLMDNRNAGLNKIEEENGLIDYSDFYYIDGFYTISYTDPVFAKSMTELSTLEETDAFFAGLSWDADTQQVLHCTEQLYQDLLTDEKDHSIDHTRIKRLDDIMSAHGIIAGSYIFEEGRHFIILNDCTHYPGMKIIYALNNDNTDFLTERERQTMAAALAFAEDAKTQVPGKEAADGSPDSLSTDRQLQIAAYIHDRLCRGIKYTIDDSIDEDDTAIGALLNGEANCDGYADAFYLVGTMAGLTVTYQHGESLDDEENYWKDETHLWNLLQLDGTWRLVDVTWDDSDEYGAEYTWFNIGLDRAERTHNWNHETGEPLLPQTDLSTRPENEYTVSTIDEAIEAVHEASSKYSKIYLYFENEDAASKYEQVLKEFGPDWSNGSYTWNEDMQLLRVYKNK